MVRASRSAVPASLSTERSNIRLTARIGVVRWLDETFFEVAGRDDEQNDARETLFQNLNHLGAIFRLEISRHV